MTNSMKSRKDEEIQTTQSISQVPRIIPRGLLLLPIHMLLGSPGQAAPVDKKQQTTYSLSIVTTKLFFLQGTNN